MTNVTNFEIPGNNSTLPNQIVLDVENVTNIGNGLEEASAVWSNVFPANYTGIFILQGSWVPTASNITLTLNGKTIMNYQSSQGMLEIQAGTVSIPQGGTAAFAVTFNPVSTFSLNGVLFYINGFGVTTPILTLITAVIVAFTAAYARFVTKTYKAILTEVAGILAFALMAVAFMLF